VTRTAAVVVGLAVLAALGGLLGIIPDYYLGLLTSAAILALFAMSLDLLSGFTGLESLGHAAFFGTGAYVVALLALHGHTEALELLGAAAAGGVLMGVPFAAVALRASGPYFLIMTMALAYLPWSLVIKVSGVTGGDNGLAGIPRPSLFGLSLDRGPVFLCYTLAVVLLASAVLAAIGRSSFGTSLRGIRGNASRMAALGYNVWLVKFVCFLISACFAGIAGALFASYNSFVSPDSLGLGQSADAFVAMIIGGAGTLLGPALGGAALVLLHFTVGQEIRYWNLVLGLIYLAVVLLAPNGIAAALRRAFAKRSGGAVAEAEAA
jgi:branched-chain amino acid transport system permease protein